MKKLLQSFKNTASLHMVNMKGKKLDRKILVIESDDWGTIRMPSVKVYQKFLEEGIRVDRCPYNKFDTLESVTDLNHIYETLDRIRDYKGNPAVITANTLMANPDFSKIKESNFTGYYYKPFTTTFEEYYPDENTFGLWKEGVKNKFIYPQLHGREHLNPEMWLEEVQTNEHVRKAFDSEFFGLSMITSPLINKPYLASLIYRDDSGKKAVEKSLQDASMLFNESFGFTSKSFIAPLYTWNDDLEPAMLKNGIKYIQAANSHKHYDYATNKRSKKGSAFGTVNLAGQTYLNRNCDFEPSLLKNSDGIDKCFKEIENAFFWKKPAVISMHRLNFIGGLVEDNRTTNLKNLEVLLKKVLKKWPETEFMSSAELGEITEKA